MPSDVLVDAHDFNRDPAVLTRVRKAMADGMEALGPARQRSSVIDDPRHDRCRVGSKKQ